MPGFFEDLSAPLAAEAEAMSSLLHTLREDRKAVLARHAHSEADTLLAAIRSGELAEHPAYEDYLSACTLQEAYDATRETLLGLLAEAGRSA